MPHGNKEANSMYDVMALDRNRSFSFYRKPGADLMLEENEVNYDLIRKGRVFHFGSVSLTGEPFRTATMKAVKFAKQQGLLISYDPNLREPLWDSLDEAKVIISEDLHYDDVLKVSEEELHFLTDSMDLDKGTKWISDKYGISVIFVTLGNKGMRRLGPASAVCVGRKSTNSKGFTSSYIKEKVVYEQTH